jgi:hypothetical protein
MPEYSSTSTRVLEYFNRSTGVLLGKYWQQSRRNGKKTYTGKSDYGLKRVDFQEKTYLLNNGD